MNATLNVICFFVMLLCMPVQANQMLYDVNNYQGSIGPYLIHLSLQHYKFSNDINIEGSYYYDNHNTPIPLYGVQAADKLWLCEVSGKYDFEKFIVQGEKYDAKNCPMKLVKNIDGLGGLWEGGGAKLLINLKKVSDLHDGVLRGDASELEIPFWGNTKKHIFIGLYEKDKNGVVINKINVIEKDSGKKIQVIDPGLYGCNFGFFMTSIFQNVEKEGSSILLNCNSYGPDVNVVYSFNKRKSIYIAELK
ncbi:hypothetical protein U1D46_004333 [Cronobacter dublinensis]|nr:hypothetical protein [Cronobacter dublinensis]